VNLQVAEEDDVVREVADVLHRRLKLSRDVPRLVDEDRRHARVLEISAERVHLLDHHPPSSPRSVSRYPAIPSIMTMSAPRSSTLLADHPPELLWGPL